MPCKIFQYFILEGYRGETRSRNLISYSFSRVHENLTDIFTEAFAKEKTRANEQKTATKHARKKRFLAMKEKQLETVLTADNQYNIKFCFCWF